MSEREWHYVHERTREGPVPESALRTRLENAELPMDVLVWCDALADWIAANEEPTFQNVEVCPRRPEPEPVPVATPEPARRKRKAAVSPARTKPASGAQRITATPPVVVNPEPPGFYLTRGGTNSGPYRHAEIVDMLVAGAVVWTDLLWREGLSTWTPVSALFIPPPGLRASLPPALPTTPPSIAPPTLPQTEQGIGRPAYWGIFTGITFVAAISDGNGFVMLLITVGLCFATAHRLKSVGSKPWVWLLIFVPFVNFLVVFACLFAPTNWMRTKP